MLRSPLKRAHDGVESFYFIITLAKAPTYYYIKRSQRHLCMRLYIFFCYFGNAIKCAVSAIAPWYFHVNFTSSWF